MDNAVTWVLGLGLALFLVLTCFEACSVPEPALYQSKQDDAALEGKGEYYYDAGGKIRFRLFELDE